MKELIIIPARFKSSRLPGKPLIVLNGKTLIQRVWEKVSLAMSKESIVIATEDKSIFDHCESFGAKVIMTSDKCLTGTDRLCEVSQKIEADLYINVQGDEPLISPDDILKVIANAKLTSSEVSCGYCKIENKEDFLSPNIPKVVFDLDKKLLYMSRAPIPSNKQHAYAKAYKQVCIYTFTKKSLENFSSVQNKTPFEEIEDIEILRFLELGIDVQMTEVSSSSIAVDTPEDVKRIEAFLKKKDELPS